MEQLVGGRRRTQQPRRRTNEWNSETSASGGGGVSTGRRQRSLPVGRRNVSDDRRPKRAAVERQRPAGPTTQRAADRLASQPARRQMSQTIATERQRRGWWSQINGLVRAGWRSAADRYTALGRTRAPIPTAGDGGRSAVCSRRAEWQRWSVGRCCGCCGLTAQTRDATAIFDLRTQSSSAIWSERLRGRERSAGPEPHTNTPTLHAHTHTALAAAVNASLCRWIGPVRWFNLHALLRCLIKHANPAVGLYVFASLRCRSLAHRK